MKPTDYKGISTEDVKKILEFECAEDDIGLLMAEITETEIKRVVFAMAADKSPGPDGYTSKFFKAAWTVIGKEFVLAIQSFFDYGFLPKGINSTILALIPKKEEVKQMKDYRPISCCNVLYKVISKILAKRLKKILPGFISPTQSAFVKDRLVMENVLLASELVKNYHKDSVSARCSMQIDISKAFDSVQWPFVLSVLTAINVPPRFVLWIKRCIEMASFCEDETIRNKMESGKFKSIMS